MYLQLEHRPLRSSWASAVEHHPSHSTRGKHYDHPTGQHGYREACLVGHSIPDLESCTNPILAACNTTTTFTITSKHRTLLTPSSTRSPRVTSSLPRAGRVRARSRSLHYPRERSDSSESTFDVTLRCVLALLPCSTALFQLAPRQSSPIRVYDEEACVIPHRRNSPSLSRRPHTLQYLPSFFLLRTRFQYYGYQRPHSTNLRTRAKGFSRTRHSPSIQSYPSRPRYP
ncbi:hypothetical protein V8E52_004780 [Russula decolorans]